MQDTARPNVFENGRVFATTNQGRPQRGSKPAVATSAYTQLQELPEARVEVGEVEYNVQASMDDMDGLELTARVQERAHSLSLQHLNEITRLGGEQMQFVQTQAAKQESGQASIQATLTPLETAGGYVDVVVVGCGPAGLALAAELGAKKNLSVGLVGPDAPLVNTYGVWVDEFAALGLEHVLDATWPQSMCFFGRDQPSVVRRAYGRVHRPSLQRELLGRCKRGNVLYRAGTVKQIWKETGNGEGSMLVCGDGSTLRCKLVVVATGAAAGKFIQYEEQGVEVAAQTAYGIEAEVEGYPFDKEQMLFMDYRRHHAAEEETEAEVPSFLYAMPTRGSNRVFLEETCLATRPALPFKELKQRLYRRCDKLGIKVGKVLEEEWSHIPLGGPLPKARQEHVGFGAAANLVHPATGYSIARTLSAAPKMADAIADSLTHQRDHGGSSADVAAEVWTSLWSPELRRQSSFQVFGMELLADLSLAEINQFFATFFALPEKLWTGFLCSGLSSMELLGFALVFFVHAPNHMRVRLLMHLVQHPTGEYMAIVYAKGFQQILDRKRIVGHGTKKEV